jgi:multidrug efflux system outer membrane protein
LFSPLLDWGKNKSRVEAQQARVAQAKARYEGAVLNALREVSDALIDSKTYHAENEQRLKQIAASRNAAKLARARYNDGVSPYLEVLDVERSLYSAELDASDTYRQYLSALARLYKSLGGGV